MLSATLELRRREELVGNLEVMGLDGIGWIVIYLGIKVMFERELGCQEGFR